MLIDYRNLKSAGVYTFEVDNTQMPVIRTSALRLLVGWNPTGPINVPVFINNDKERRAFFGDIDPKFEAKGAFLNRSIKTALQAGPVFALNLFNIDSEDLVNYAALSLDSAKPNPDQDCNSKVSPSKDYRDTNHGNFIGSAQLANIYDRVRFWNPSEANVLKYMRYKSVGDPEVKKPLFGFVNTCQSDMSILVFKPSGLVGYDVTVREWFGGEDSIPYNWLRPTDYISDYFVQVVAVKGLWSDFGSYAADPYWANYFTTDGIKYNKITDFLAANSITQIGSWSGCLIPNFVDQTGASDYIIDKINNSSIITGLTATLNLEALNNLEMEIEKGENGKYQTGTAHSVQRNPSMCEGEGTSQGAAAPFQIDLVGHNRTDISFKDETDKTKPEFPVGPSTYSFLSYNKHSNSGESSTNLPGAIFLKNLNTVIVPDPRIFGLSDSSVEAPENLSEKITNKISRFEYNKILVKAVNEKIGEKVAKIDGAWSKTATSAKYNIDVDIVTETTTEEPPTQVEKKQFNSKSLTKSLNDFKKDLIKELNSKYDAISKDPDLTYNTILFNKDRTNGKYTFLAGIADKITKASVLLSDTISDNGQVLRYFDNLSESDLLYNITSRDDIKKAPLQIGLKGDPIDTESLASAIYPGLTHISDVRSLTLRQLAVDDRIKKDVDELRQELKNLYLGKNKGKDILSIPDDTLFKVITCIDPIYSGQFDKTKISLIPDSEESALGGNNPQEEKLKSAISKIVTDWVESNLKDITSEGLATKLADKLPTEPKATSVELNFADFVEAIFKTTEDNVEISGAANIKKQIDSEFTQSTDIRNVILSDELISKIKILPEGIVFSSAAKKLGDGQYLDNSIIVQRPINSPEISSSLRFIPLRGLNITAKHMPGFDKNGCRNVEAGVEKIYEMLMDPGIYRGLTNPDMINYRYIIDTMAGGLKPSMGGKVYLSRLAKARGKCTALLNAPSIKSFMSSTNPYFCDVYNQGKDPVPPFDSKYVPLGGNNKMAANNSFSLMSEDDGATYTGVFTPFLKYSDGYRTVLVPPAADVSNTFIRKYNGGDPYAIVANTKGILNGLGIIGVEENLDKYDRDNFEPMGLNSIIQRNNQIMIYSNRTAYQRVRSDFNFLHVRELLNTIETEVEAVLQNFVFEYNNAITRGAIITLVNPILSTMRDAGAIYNYELEFNETPDDNAMIGDEVAVLSIGVVVNKGMEKIVQVISINKRGKIKLVR